MAGRCCGLPRLSDTQSHFCHSYTMSGFSFVQQGFTPFPEVGKTYYSKIDVLVVHWNDEEMQNSPLMPSI